MFLTAAEKKNLLLVMARSGKPRPHCRKHPLGCSLGYYTRTTSQSYDARFDYKIRQLAPLWFLSGKKQVLLDMAKRGEPRPHDGKHPLGSALGCYTQKTNQSYDAQFDHQIRQLAPLWFLSGRKQLLLDMATRGEPRPQPKTHPLGFAVCSYTNKSSGAYDAQFHRKIRKIAPQWCVGRDNAAKNKKELLAMAKRGESRPNCHKHRLGGVLCIYTNKNTRCYDKKFNREIRRIAPQWFIDTASEKKTILLAMARNREPKPNYRKHPLGNPLSCYTQKSSKSYDREFNREIRKIAPQWFRQKVSRCSRGERIQRTRGFVGSRNSDV